MINNDDTQLIPLFIAECGELLIMIEVPDGTRGHEGTAPFLHPSLRPDRQTR
jgi:hypothetical protein